MYLVHAEAYEPAYEAARAAGCRADGWRYIREPADLHGYSGGVLHTTRRATWSAHWEALVSTALAAGMTVAYIDA